MKRTAVRLPRRHRRSRSRAMRASISTTRGMHGMPDYGNVLRATDSASLHAAAQ